MSLCTFLFYTCLKRTSQILGFSLWIFFGRSAAQAFSRHGWFAWSRTGRYYLRALFPAKVRCQRGYGHSLTYSSVAIRVFLIPKLANWSRTYSCERAQLSAGVAFDALSESLTYSRGFDYDEAIRFRERARALSPASPVFTLQIERANRCARERRRYMLD